MREERREGWLGGQKEGGRGGRMKGNNTQLLFCRAEVTHTLRDHIYVSFPSLFSLTILVRLKQEDEDCLPIFLIATS